MDPRLAPGRDQQLVRRGAPSRPRRRASSPPRARSAALALTPSRSSIPSALRASDSASPRAGASLGSRRSSPSAIATEAPSRERAWPSSTPTGPPPRTTRRCGISVSEVASRLVQTSSSSSSPSIGGIMGSDPVAMISRSVSSSFPSISTSPGPLIRASPRRSSTPLSVELFRLMGVVPVGDLEVPPGQRLLHVDRPGDRLAGARRLPRLREDLTRPQQRLRGDAGPVAALAGDQLALADGDLHSAGHQVLRAHLAGDPGADHDCVVALSHLDDRARSRRTARPARGRPP